MKKFMLALAAALTAATPIAAEAQYRDHYPRYSYERPRHDYRRHHDRSWRDYRHDRQRTYAWRGNNGRYYCRRSDGTTGTVVGAIAGGLLGRTVDTRGDRTLGTVLGGVGGALVGREIDRGNCR